MPLCGNKQDGVNLSVRARGQVGVVGEKLGIEVVELGVGLVLKRLMSQTTVLLT